MESVRLISYVASEEEEKRYEKPELALEKIGRISEFGAGKELVTRK